VEAPATEREYREGVAPDKGKGVPVYVMMPLDSVTMNNTEPRKAINASLQALGERRAGYLQWIGGFIGSNTCSEPPPDDDDDGGSDPNNDGKKPLTAYTYI
jgi:hypothetical protein